MASSAFQVQLQLSSLPRSSTLNTFQFHPSLHFSKPAKQKTPNLQVLLCAKLSRDTTEQLPGSDVGTVPNANLLFGFSAITKSDAAAGKKSLEKNRAGVETRHVPEDRNEKMGLNSRRKAAGSGDSSTRLKGKRLLTIIDKTGTSDNASKRRIKDGKNGATNVVEREKRTKKARNESPETILRVGLDLCSKRGDVVGALRLYDLAKKEGIKMGQYHYAVVLYLCSSAATGTVRPAKSGRGSRSLSSGEPVEGNSVVESESSKEFGEMAKWISGGSELSQQNLEGEPGIEHSMDGIPVEVGGNDLSSRQEDLENFINGSMENCPQSLQGLVQEMRNADYSSSENDGIQINNVGRRFALHKGFEVYNDMSREKVPMNEATLTSVARMAMAFGDGNMAFDMVKKMKEYDISPRLRSYGPALAIFCSKGDVEKAFMVEKHMLEHGVQPEEPELQALLRVSVEAGKSDKVYYVLHRLRVNVRQVSKDTADLIERWFKSKVGSRVGKRRWDKHMITQAIENGGGGWHGKGWLGQGKWTVCHSPVDSDGSCKSCGEKLATIDLDPEETENFAKSVAALASRREKNSNFQKFQKWLDYYGPFEAVVDAANVGLYSQRRFKPSKVNAVVNGIRQMLPSRKWPLIVLHNRRITGEKMDEPFNRSLIEKWKNADALYATPTGSNDDWYWLYAAIKCRCLIVTNDEMRDHLFQLLGNDIFPKWKERHQVHFNFTEAGPVFQMPPPCSIVIQESDKGHWHIPIVSQLENEDDRIWLCCTRANSGLQGQESSDVQRELHLSHQKKGKSRSGAQFEPKFTGHQSHSQAQLVELTPDPNYVTPPPATRNRASIIPELESAEKLGGCVIDFQI